MRQTFRLEGNICFALVPPGFELESQLYELYPDGSKNLLIRVVPIAAPAKPAS